MPSRHHPSSETLALMMICARSFMVLPNTFVIGRVLLTVLNTFHTHKLDHCRSIWPLHVSLCHSHIYCRCTWQSFLAQVHFVVQAGTISVLYGITLMSGNFL